MRAWTRSASDSKITTPSADGALTTAIFRSIPAALFPTAERFRDPMVCGRSCLHDQDRFARCLGSKLLTYALGRKMSLLPRAGNETFSELVEDIVISPRSNRYPAPMQLTKPLSRRTLLRGFGAAVSLPLLDAMVPAFASTLRRSAPPGVRLRSERHLHGSVDALGLRTGFRTSRASSRRLRRIARTSSCCPAWRKTRAARSATARAITRAPLPTYLTGVHPKKTDGAGIHAGISVDQIAASQIGNATRFPSLEFACEDGRMGGTCDTGYSCAYSNTLSWRTPSMPLPPEMNPRAVFERLFGA